MAASASCAIIAGLWYAQKSQLWRAWNKPEREYAGIDQQDMNVGWLSPNLPMFLLDKMPIEPWASLSKRYEAAGLQRKWDRYSMSDSVAWEWWINETA